MADVERLERVMTRIEADPFLFFQGTDAAVKRVSKSRTVLKTVFSFACHVLIDADYRFVEKGRGQVHAMNGLTAIYPFVFVRPDGTEIAPNQVNAEARKLLDLPDTTGYWLFKNVISSSVAGMRKHVEAVKADVAVDA